MDHFINPVESYERKIDLIPTYIEESASYVHRLTGRPLDECREYVRRQIAPGGKMALKIPEAMVLVKDRHGDRQVQSIPFDKYLEGVVESQEVLSPTLAAYTHPSKKKSLLAVYISTNLARRKKAKHEKFVAKMAGNKTLENIKEAEQTSLKIKNNSLSGAHCSPYTILWNKSSHSTLTSTCRTATSYGNANNEKFLYGNRHYWCPDVVKSNIISIVNHTDYVKLQKVLDKYGIVAPTVEQTMQCIVRSTDPYWRSDKESRLIHSLVTSLSPLERAAFVYTSDFYHLAQYNPGFVRQFLTDLSSKITEPLSVEESKTWIGKMDANLKAFVSIICAKELAGGKIEDAVERPEAYGLIGATVKYLLAQLDRYEDLIRALWVTDNLPASIFHLPNIIRRGAITSDTDSTIFTVQYWTEWYVGKLDFSDTSIAIANTMVYLAAQLIRHILATFSGNMGVAREDIFRLSMKNEYYFPVFTLTSRAKHYYAYIAAQEGNVYEKYDTEIKGVALRNSNVPVDIMKKAKQLMKDCMDAVIAGKKISMTKVLRRVARIEEGIRTSVIGGSYELLTKLSIKTAESYKNPEVSNFIHYQMWEDVFAEKYGHAPEPPYVAIKISVDADNPTRLKEWLDQIEDRSIADKLQNWLASRGKTNVSTLLLPEPILVGRGLPPEVVLAVNIRSLISNTMEAFYLILESLGIYMRNDNITRLVSDERWLLALDDGDETITVDP